MTLPRLFTVRTRTLVTAAVVLAFNIVLYALPGYRYLETYNLGHAFEPVGEHGFKAALPDSLSSVPFDAGNNANSPVSLTENSAPLGPAHYPADSVENTGKGEFVHLNGEIIFSASDNSDPRTNGRTYAISYPRNIPALVFLPLALVDFLALLFLAYQFSRRFHPQSRARTAYVVIACGVTLLMIEMVSRIILQGYLAGSGELVQSIYTYMFTDNQTDFNWEAQRYLPHQYIEYGLNPDTTQGGEPENNPTYLIRRSEPIRPRDQVKWRALAIGGSTTYDESVLDEKQTWVYDLEMKIRAKYGQDYDVINGGVGGYTVYENFIHYITLLTYLDPDVVILFEGINDVFPRLYGTLQDDYSNYTRPWWKPADQRFSRDTSILHFLSTYQLVRMSREVMPVLDNGINAIVRYPTPPSDTWKDALQRNSTDQYQQIMTNFVTLLRGQGKKVIIVPQHIVPRTSADEIFKIGIDQNNEADRAVAGRFGLPFVDAVGQEATFTPADFADFVHFNPGGAAKMAQIMYDALTSGQADLMTPIDHSGALPEPPAPGR